MRMNMAWWQVMILVSSVALATVEAADPQPVAKGPATTQAATKPSTAAELEQLVAPIALYPDSLLAQIFMASTYPLEVVQAERWVAGHKDLKGDALTAELEKNSWDPSVKSLVNFPQVLTMMSQQLDWTTKLGDAFIADQASVMAAVQKLRAKAQASGNLKSTEQQKVIVEPAPATQTVVVQSGEAPPPQIIRIESPSPQVVYVPTYNPTVVYGPWPYPAYPPYYYRPPGYVASNVVSFGVGVAVGAAWGYAWGGCNWGHGDVDVDVNRNVNVNNNINRQNYNRNVQNRTANVQGGTTTFQHDPAHRKGVSYRDPATARQYGELSNANAIQARENYRGRADAGRQDLARGGANQFSSGARTGGSAGVGAGAGAGGVGASPSRAGGAQMSPNRTSATPDRTPAAPPRSSATPNRSPPSQGGAFQGVNQGGSAARASSSRGQASRSAAPRPSGGSAMRSGGARAGGGRR